MAIPDDAEDLVKLALKAGDVYIAAAVHEVSTGRDRKLLESLMFAKRRDALMLARWEHTPPSVLEALSNSADGAVVIRLDKNPNTPDLVLSKLYSNEVGARKGNLALTVLIAQHQNTPMSVLENIAQFNNDLESLLAVSKNPVADAGVLKVLMHRMDSSPFYITLKKNMAANPSASADLLDRIYAEGDAYTRAAVINHANFPQPLIAHAMNDSDVFVMRQLAANNRLTKEMLARLALSSDKAVRCGVASNLLSTKVLINKLVNDDSHTVRRAVAARADLTMANIKSLMCDSDHWVRLWLARNPKVPRKFLLRLSKDHRDDVRRAVARNPCCPIRLLKILAKDENAWVRAAVAYQQKSPKRLMMTLSKELDIDVLSGVANNPNTPLKILQKLIASPEPDVRRGVVLNHKATRKTLLPLLEDSYYLHRLMLVASPQLKDKDKWLLRDDPDFQVRFVVFKWLANRLNKLIVQ